MITIKAFKNNQSEAKTVFTLSEEDYYLLKDVFDLYHIKKGVFIDPYQKTILHNSDLINLVKILNDYLKKINIYDKKNKILDYYYLFKFLFEEGYSIIFIGG